MKSTTVLDTKYFFAVVNFNIPVKVCLLNVLSYLICCILRTFHLQLILPITHVMSTIYVCIQAACSQKVNLNRYFFQVSATLRATSELCKTLFFPPACVNRCILSFSLSCVA